MGNTDRAVLLLMLQLLQHQVGPSVPGHHSPGVSVCHHLQLPEQGAFVPMKGHLPGAGHGERGRTWALDAGATGAMLGCEVKATGHTGVRGVSGV